jgi:hypothetical protein
MSQKRAKKKQSDKDKIKRKQEELETLYARVTDNFAEWDQSYQYMQTVPDLNENSGF